MTSPTRFAQSENRFGEERRRGGDSRTPEERRRQGERRGGEAARLSPRAATWLHVSLTAAILIFADAHFYRGAHSTQLALQGGAYASSLAHRWISAGFAP